MWKYLEGVKPPEPKRARTDAEKRESQRQYDRECRDRRWQHSWSTEFPWVIHDGREKLFCKLCRQSYGDLSVSKLPDKGMFQKYSKGPFVVGSCNFKRSSLVDHQNSSGHGLAMKHVKNKYAKPGESEADKCIEKLNSAVINKLDKLFRTAHAVAKHNRPFSDYVWMSELDERKGTMIINQSMSRLSRLTEYVQK